MVEKCELVLKRNKFGMYSLIIKQHDSKIIGDVKEQEFFFRPNELMQMLSEVKYLLSPESYIPDVKFDLLKSKTDI